MVHRLVGAALEKEPRVLSQISKDALDATPLMDNSFVVTDGAKSFTVTLIEVGGGSQPLLMFLNELPPRDCDLWVVHHTLNAAPHETNAEGRGGVICFTPGTRIMTPKGEMLIDSLREGDLVQTKDNGPQPVRWIGSRRMTGARLFAMPKLRPVRIAPGLFGNGVPDEELVVSPDNIVGASRADRRMDSSATSKPVTAMNCAICARSADFTGITVQNSSDIASNILRMTIIILPL
jgi:hypothetical protein